MHCAIQIRNSTSYIITSGNGIFSAIIITSKAKNFSSSLVSYSNLTVSLTYGNYKTIFSIFNIRENIGDGNFLNSYNTISLSYFSNYLSSRSSILSSLTIKCSDSIRNCTFSSYFVGASIISSFKFKIILFTSKCIY